MGRIVSHTFTKGTGGGRTLDIPSNLTSLGDDLWCGCHYKHHNGGRPKSSDLIDITAHRLHTTSEAVLTELYRAARIIKATYYKCPFTGWEWFK